jgi:hypothetical protein
MQGRGGGRTKSRIIFADRKVIGSGRTLACPRSAMGFWPVQVWRCRVASAGCGPRGFLACPRGCTRDSLACPSGTMSKRNHGGSGSPLDQLVCRSLWPVNVHVGLSKSRPLACPNLASPMSEARRSKGRRSPFRAHESRHVLRGPLLACPIPLPPIRTRIADFNRSDTIPIDRESRGLRRSRPPRLSPLQECRLPQAGGVPLRPRSPRDPRSDAITVRLVGPIAFDGWPVQSPAPCNPRSS